MTFTGFEAANTTPVPDILFDTLLPDLSGAELKVLLYIIRRTSGFKKTMDAISLTQFEGGIITKDGRVLDRGCGLSRETVCNALQSLEKRGCIKSDKRSHNGGKEITAYSINFAYDEKVVGKSDQLVQQSDYPSRKIREKVVGKSDIQLDSKQETVKQETEREEGANAPTPAASSSFHFPQNDEERQQYDDFMCNARKEVDKANNGTRHSKTIKAIISKRKPAKKETPPAISAEAIRIMDDWDSIFPRKSARTENHIKAAELLVPCAPTRDDLSNIRKFCYKSNPKWYNDKGVSLIDVAKNFDKWQSLQEAPQMSEVNGHSPPGSNGAKPRPSALVSEEQSAKNKARLYAAAAAKQAEKAGQHEN